MWRELVEQYEDVEVAEPAAEQDLLGLEHRIGTPLPTSLRALLTEFNGVVDEDGTDVVWNAEQIARTNEEFRTREDLRSLYMPFDALFFFGDNGGGDQFALPISPRRPDVFVWNHENDSRTWVASNMEQYLRNALSRPGEDWYR
ncbi:SMI1/KNR4 family protein [Streptomyces sp. H27-S2]|uniref:SMI1/KNR4 family protein n=1 Tax=Streptomyces antarcticus TaxID=2996458 RepID=UPI00227205E8|nr:SMI1/KNR4 family protein [Streptomyces sp. H27-S2]MCY0949451.1 SMI1/KNR4 family protein [Streptomyces sp. H27-S2]